MQTIDDKDSTPYISVYIYVCITCIYIVRVKVLGSRGYSCNS